MALITEQPKDLPTALNDLDSIPDDLLSIPPAYLSFGTTPCGLESPPNMDDAETYVIRARCVGESRSERSDGEVRHVRKLQIQWCIKQGQPEPPDDESDQGALFDEDGEVSDEASGLDDVERPDFSDSSSE